MQLSLTPKQQRVLDYLQHEIASNGQAPSLRRAATDLGVSHAAIAQILKTLEEKGYLKREGRYSRTIYLLNQAREPGALQRWREIPTSKLSGPRLIRKFSAPGPRKSRSLK